MRWMPDGAGTRAKIGVLTPHMDPVPETEFQALVPEGVSVHSARVPLGMIGEDGEIIPYVGLDIAKRFVSPPAIDNEASLLAAVSPNAIVVAFTSSSYVLGIENDESLRKRLEKRTNGLPVIIQCEALVKALKTLNVSRISLVHPPWFSDELDQLGVDYFRQQGVDVVEHGQARLTEAYGDMLPEQIAEWVVAHTPNTAEAAVIGGGGFRATGAIKEMERLLGRPVLSANQASCWLALRKAGIDDVIGGYGAIMEMALDERG